ncbi:unnamed protein product [Mytilus coruscus]|uniref:Uncharacterized protein n=1 Tax=Mytilus coruscus TaxID=42192 RepID=A0A6J8B548_MYTCO|nr:unnamed protein product [Mytilus coruscus]
MTPPGNAYLIVLCALAFLACMVIIYTNAKRIIRNGSNTLYRRDNTAWLKLKFLYLFGAGGIAYQIIAYIYRRECSSPRVHLDNILAVHIALILFFLTQTAFIRIMFKYVLKNSIVIFYTVSFILVTNVAVWTYYTVTGYYITKDYYSVSNISDCNYNSTLISKVYWRSRVIVDPMIMEYAMLASIFVFEMWPLYFQKEQSDTEDTRRNMEELEDRLEICSINVYDQITETSPLIQNKSEETKCCFEVKSVLISIVTRMKMHCNVFVGILAVFPPALLDILDIFVSKGTYTFPLDYYSVSNISDCNYNSTFSKVYWRSRVIVDPMIMEYALLASIFVFEMWPLYFQKEQSDTKDTRRNMEKLEDRLEICSINVYDQITETSPLIQNKSEEMLF